MHQGGPICESKGSRRSERWRKLLARPRHFGWHGKSGCAAELRGQKTGFVRCDADEFSSAGNDPRTRKLGLYSGRSLSVDDADAGDVTSYFCLPLRVVEMGARVEV